MPTVDVEKEQIEIVRDQQESNEAQNKENDRRAAVENNMQRIAPYIEKDKPAPNDTAKYLIDQIRECQTERVALSQNIDGLKQKVAMMQQRRIELNGIIRKYADDIAEFIPLEGEPAKGKNGKGK